jgi:hypothetical protein
MQHHRETAAAGALALVLIIVFAVISPGVAMWWTFIPSMITAYACHMASTARAVPDPDRVLPVYLIALGWQFLHFAEEFMNGFYRRWPEDIFDAPAMSVEFFVLGNMISYAAFAMGTLALFKGVRVPMLIVWFFAVQGVAGNAVGHLLYSLISGDLGFPGFYTSLGYWIIGPVLIHRLWATTRAPADQPRRLSRSSRPRIDLNQ